MGHVVAKRRVQHVVVGKNRDGVEYILESVPHNQTPDERLAAYERWPNLAGPGFSDIHIALEETTTTYTRLTA